MHKQGLEPITQDNQEVEQLSFKEEIRKVHIDCLLSERYIELISKVDLLDGEINLEAKYPTKSFKRIIKIVISSGGLTGFLLMILKILSSSF